MELDETVELMTSKNYKDRFKAEVYQLNIRIQKLQSMCDKWDKGELNFVPACPRCTYDLQLKAMNEYLAILFMRAKMEGIKLS